ncbi:MAG TPA: hypothetical protein VMV83_13635 [Rectinemataceae bacterium]|nr:hypothetical protein [Rectinemataceae bacterium]
MLRKTFDEKDRAAFGPAEKVALVATINDEGLPHVSLLTTLSALGEQELTIGEFSRGLSKEFMRRRPAVGFLVMSLDRRLWRGRALWKRSAKDGPEYVKYNKQPMFRYNSYFGINTVHYLDLVGVEGPGALPMAGIVVASLATAIKAPFARPAEGDPVLPTFLLPILDALDSLNFLCFVDAEGFPRIVPVLQARSAGSSRIVFTPGPWGAELAALREGASVALFSMNLKMESFLARGVYSPQMGGGSASKGLAGKGLAGIDLDFLYDSAPPLHGQVWPPRPLEALVEA